MPLLGILLSLNNSAIKNKSGLFDLVCNVVTVGCVLVLRTSSLDEIRHEQSFHVFAGFYCISIHRFTIIYPKRIKRSNLSKSSTFFFFIEKTVYFLESRPILRH